MTRTARWSLAVAAVAALALLVPAAADWLVTEDGTRVETEGPWEVRDRLVVFKRPDGTFASMRLSDVDLEASERLTREMAEAVREPKDSEPQGRREVVARLTEADLPPVSSQSGREDGSPSPKGSEERTDGAGESDPEEPESLQIVTWRELGGPERDGLEFVGDVRNVTENTALGVEVSVILFDQEGEEIAQGDALLTSSALPPGQTAGFRASFPGVFHYARVDLEASGRMVLSGDSPQTEDAEEPPAG